MNFDSHKAEAERYEQRSKSMAKLAEGITDAIDSLDPLVEALEDTRESLKMGAATYAQLAATIERALSERIAQLKAELDVDEVLQS